MKKILFRLCFLILLVGVGKVNATTYFVQHHGDAPNATFALFTGSLREAIGLANVDNTASFGAPHIIIDTVTTSSIITLTSQLPNINEDVIITGANNRSGLLTVKAFNPIAFNIFNIGSISGSFLSQYVELNNIRIQNGFTVTLGGGINVQNCSLTLNNCEILNNSNFNGLGAGIYAGDAALNINNSTIANNTINNGNGAGLFFAGSVGVCNIINSTITGNTAISGSGGGADFNSTAIVKVISSTITNNSAVDGGGFFINQNQIFIENSIILNNVATNAGADIFKGTSVDAIPGVNSQFGYNIVGDNNGFTADLAAVTNTNVNASDVTQVVSSTLANNGGRTQTLLPTPCSPTIDAGFSVMSPTTDTDQRGTAIVNTKKDIGAVEYPSLIVTDQNSCGPATFTLTVSGGTTSTSPFYNWFKTETSSTVLGTGSSFVTPSISAPDSFYVAEVSSCANPKRYKVRVTVFPIPPTPTIAITGFPTNTASIQLCVGSTAEFTSSSVSTGNYAWTPGGQTTQAITVGLAGSYVVTITDANNCTKVSDPIVVTMVSKPNVPVITSSIGGSGFSVCATDTAKLTATTSSTPIASYEWFLNTITTNVSVDNIDAIAEGDYTVIVSSIPGCSSTSASFSIIHNPLPTKPTLTVGGPTTFCNGGSVQLTSSDITNTNTWNTVPQQSGVSIIVDTTGNIFATVSDGNNCKNYSDTISVIVNIPTKPVVTISNANPTTFCDGDSIELTSSPSASYLWSNGATTQSITVKVSTVDLAVTTIDINNCSATSDSLQIVVIPITTPVITASGATTFCEGGSVDLTSDQLINNTWTPGLATTQSITVTTSGDYYVLIPGCSDTSNVITVTVNLNPVAPTISNSTPLTFCDGDSVILVANSPESNLTYIWTASTANTNDSLIVKASGSYSVTVSNTFSCSATSAPTTVSVLTLPAEPVVTASGPLSFCEGDSVRLTSSIPTNNLWSNGETTESILVTAPGDYFVKVTVTNNCLSLNSDTFTVDVRIPVKPFITADDTLTFCDGDSVHLTSSIATNILWSNGSTAQTITVFASDIFNVSALDLGNGCTGKSRDTIVTVLPTTQPVVTASTPTVFCIGGNVVLTSSSPAGNQWFESGNPIVGQTGTTLSITTSGNYTVSLPGCALQSVVVPVTVNPLPLPPTIIAAGNTTFCADNSVTLASSYTNPGNLWSTGATTQSIVSTTSQSYTVTYTDGNGCTSLPSLSITTDTLSLPIKPIITTGSTLEVFCTGGTIDLISNYTFNNTWSSTPTNNDTITVNVSGTYTVTHTDANGCTATSNPKVINEVAPFTPTITLSGNDTICQGQSLTLTSSEPFGNEWSTGDTTQSITISQPGNYNVLLQSCDLPSDSIKVAVLALPTKPILTSFGANPICQGDSSLLVSNIDNVSWSISSTIDDSLYAKTSGDYYAINTDLFGCANYSDTILINVADTPIVVLVTPTSQCGGTLTFDAGFPGSTYLWSNGATTQTVTVNSGIALSVDVTNTCGTFTSNIINVPINAIPVVALGADILQCGGSVTLDAQNAGSDFAWSTLENTQTISVSSTGTYSVTVTTAAGCSASGAINVNVDGTLPIVALGTDIAQCDGTVTLNVGNPLSTYQWNTVGSATVLGTQASFTITQTGNYVASVTNGCGTIKDTILVNINPIPVVAISPVTNACNSSVTLNAGNLGSTFLWLPNGETTQAIIVSTSGTYSVVVTNPQGCSASASSNATISTTVPVVNLGPDGNTCATSVLLDAANVGSTYTWVLPDNSIVNTQTVNATTSGTYAVLVNNGCGVDRDTITINLLTPVTVNIGGPYTTCDVPVNLTADPQPIGSTYVWKKDANTLSFVTDNITVNATGTYQVTVTNSVGCTNSSTAQVEIDAPLVAPVLTAPASNCGTYTIDLGTIATTTSATWFDATNTQVGTGSTFNVTITGTYYVTLTNFCGSVTSNNVTINILTAPTTNLGGPYNTCSTPILLDATAQVAGTNFVWTLNNSVVADSISQTFTAQVSGTYGVTVTNVAGCSVTSSAQVIIDLPLTAQSISAPAINCGSIVIDAGTYPASTTYQWFNGVTPITGATSSTLLALVDGDYSLNVSNNCGGGTSNSISVVILPAVTVDLAGPYNTCQTPVTLSAGTQLAGSTFQWTQDGNALVASTSSIVASVNGVYGVTVTNTAGCSATSIATVSIDSPLTPPVISAPAASCGAFTINAGTFAPATIIEWLDGSNNVVANTASFTITTSGTYSVRVANNCGGGTSNSVTIDILPAVTVDLGATQTTCATPVTLDAGTQLSGSTFVWTKNSVIQPEITGTLTAFATGLYTVSVINVAGCSATSSVNIIIDNLPVAPVLAIPPAACASTTLNAGLYPEGTSYTWTSTVSNTVLGNGQTVTITQTDSLTVTLTNSCGTSTSNIVPVEILSVPTVDLGPAQNSCVTPITLDAGTQDAGSTYAWFNPSLPIANETNQTYLATVTGNYTAIVTNVAGCSTSSSVQVTIDSPLSAPVLAAQTAPTCSTYQLCVNNFPPSTNYEWFEDNSPAVVLGNGICFTATTSGTYGVRVFNNCGSTTSNTVSVTIILAPVVDLGIDKNSCVTPVTLDAGLQLATSTISWFNGTSVILGETNQTYTSTVTGTYKALVTNSAGCSTIDSVNVTIDSPLTAPTIVAPANSCTSVTFDAGSTFPASTTFEWFETASPSIVLGTNSTYTTTLSGTFGVRVINNCGASTSNTVGVTIFTNPIVNIGNDITQCGGTVNLNTSASFASYLWNDVTASTNSTLLVTSNGTYSVVVTDVNGCTAQSNSVDITINAVPTVSLGNDISLCGGTVTLSTTPTFNSYSWNTNPVSSTPTLVVSTSGEYIVAVTDVNGCTATDTVNVFIDAPFIIPVLVTPAPSCASTDLNAGTYPIGTTYSWINNSNVELGTQQILTIIATDTVSVIVSNSCGLDTSNSVIVAIIPAPTVDLAGPYETCNTPVTLNAGIQDATSTISWSNNAGVISGATSQTFAATITDLYTVTITNAAGCSNSSTATVTIDLPLVAPLLAAPAASCSNVIVNAGSYPISTQYAWFDVSNPTVVLGTNSTFTVSATMDLAVTISNQCDTVTSNTITVTILPLPIVDLGGPYNSCISPITLNAGTQPSGSTYAWSSVANGTFADSTSQTFVAVVSGSYTAAVTNAAGCTVSSTTQITIDGLLAAPVLAAPAPACLSTVLNAGSYPANTTYAWFNTTSTLPLATTATYTATVNGDYFVTVTNNCGTTTSNTISVIINPIPVVNIGTGNTQCGGTFTLDAGIGASYLWNDLAATTSQTLVVSTSGAYSVVVTDANGCSGTSNTANVTINAVPTVSIGSDVTQCGGTVTLNAGAGASFLWNDAAATTTQTLSTTSNGSYSVVVTNANGCTGTSNTAVVTINSIPVVNIGTGNTQCGGTFTLDAGIGASYLWNDLATTTTQTLVVSTSGAYSVVVTDANGCSGTSNTANVTINSVPTVNIGADVIQCGGTVTLDAGPGASYLWNDAAATTTQTLSTTSNGSYSVVVTFANGCTGTSNTVNVTIDAPLNAPVLVAPSPSCSAITLDAGTYPTGTTFQWLDLNGNISSATNQTLIVNASGTYSVKVIQNCGLVTSNSVAVTIDLIPVVAVGNTSPTCGGTTLNAGTQAPTSTFTWTRALDNTFTANTNSIVATVNDTYTVVVTNSLGCSTSASTLVNTSVSLPVVSLTSTITSCGPVTLDAQNTGSTYSWFNVLDPINSIATNQTFQVTASGSYFVVVTNNCGSVTSNTTNIIANPAVTTPVITASGPTTFCTGGSVVLTTPSVPVGSTITWINTNTIIATNVTQYTVSATDTFAVTVTNAQGCSASSPLTLVNVGSTLPVPTITANGPISFCLGGSVVLTSSYAIGNSWSPLGQTTQSITVQETGNYVVKVIDAFGCIAISDTIKVNAIIPPLALITASQPSLVCTGETIILWSASQTGNQWYLNGSLTPFSTSDIVTINETQGPLSYNVVVTDANGCSSKSPNYVFNYIPGVPKPIITSTPSEKNCDGTLTLTSSSSTGNFWYNGATTQSITINKTERAWVRVESSNGCKNTSDTTWFEATEGTSIELTYKVSEFFNAQFNISEFEGKDGSIDITTTGGVSPLTYAWTDSTGTFNFAGEDLSALGEGTYFITVNDKYGCKVSDTIRLKAPFEFKLPSGISPNGDGNNDVFIIGSIEKFPNNKVRIYNRWGGLIFTVEGYNNSDKVWRGTNENGEPLPEGTYFVVVTFPDGKTESLNKYVDLKR